MSPGRPDSLPGTPSPTQARFVVVVRLGYIIGGVRRAGCSLAHGDDASADLLEALQLELRLVLGRGRLLHLYVLYCLLVRLRLLRLGETVGVSLL